MNITDLSISLSQANLQTAIGFELLANASEMSEVQSDAIEEMVASLEIPGLGENIDISL